jgi:uncharacterized YigZ family protein
MQEYTTILDRAEDEFVERKSRFIGAIAPVETEEEALDFIAQIKHQHRDATHNTYAYVLKNGVKRYSDDGEPQGTAGVPMLDCLEKEGLVDVAVVVTRYFGGILLGAGGLVRAYSHGAKIAVDAASRKLMTTCVLLGMEFDYSFYGKINYILPKYVCRVEESDFGALVQMKVLFRQTEVDAFLKEVTELSAALVVPQVLEERFDFFEA